MNRFSRLIGFVILIILTQCKEQKAADDEFILKGKIKGLREGTLYLIHPENGDYEPIDSILLKRKEHFKFNRSIEHADVYWLQLKGNIPMAVFIEPGDYIEFQTHIDSIHTYKAAGNNTQGSLKQFIKYISARDADYDRYTQEYKLAAQQNDTYALENLNKRMEANRRTRNSIALNYAVHFGSTQIAPYVALNFVEPLAVNWYDSVYIHLQDSIKKTYYGKELKQYIEALKNTQTGRKIKPINIQTLQNKTLSIPQNQTTILYFWKTNNLASRTDALLLNAQNYKDDVQILLVNLDTDRSKLEKLPEIEQFKLPIIFDKRGIHSSLALQFGVRQPLSSIIIAPDGTIQSLGTSVSDIITQYKK